jgi:hypothetical protein
MPISEPMHMSKPGPEGPRRIEVFTAAGRRRTGTSEELNGLIVTDETEQPKIVELRPAGAA